MKLTFHCLNLFGFGGFVMLTPLLVNSWQVSEEENSFVKITNPVNDKSVIAEVVSNNVKFTDLYNSVITERIAKELVLDPKEPYVELLLISKNSTFIAKKAKTFDEEKKVAEKVPVDGITIDNLGKSKKKKIKK